MERKNVIDPMFKLDDFFTSQEERDEQKKEKIEELELNLLDTFKNHPFKVQADSQMKELQDSISKYVILNQLIVRPRPEGFYEVISGHRFIKYILKLVRQCQANLNYQILQKVRQCRTNL